ncbi:cytochrome P450 [Legionella longbeachae]|uniref:Cytochrome P450 n=1 Tax=Legionella longbeachae serogroup 1 (strain NSW150) TaxID=661367 RepID=D3HN53_LEGLN|nr:cytochrome P450 [Legionella longbeachae]VEE04419.1 Cytochrome P450 [Legionella oakridgensis]HBD7397171.1 cytochrome P450 [Legionella pneumophila]ARB92762.1 cytochrome P450 [Legionella longbeachae]ARM34073.1 cytochrome P450 [Legionella longbeachae]EEZ96696.1 cytochrome-like protein [Legionella longbeachae D-4968]
MKEQDDQLDYIIMSEDPLPLFIWDSIMDTLIEKVKNISSYISNIWQGSSQGIEAKKEKNTAGTLTYPSLGHYLTFLKDITLLKTDPAKKAQLQSYFMTFVTELGAHSLDEGSGVACFSLPDLTKVFVLSNQQAIKQLYEKSNEKKFGQKPLFQRLALILGPDNLMSSALGSEVHSKIRASILSRNESNRRNVAEIVAEFFKEYESEQMVQRQSLSELMDRLSRRVLIATYFGKEVVQPFEQLYSSSITKELIDCLFSLDPIKNSEEKELLALRGKVLDLGYNLIFSLEAISKQLMSEQSWLNYLLKVRVLSNPDAASELQKMGINSTTNLTAEQCEFLIKYSQLHIDNTLLSTLIRDVINESLFIPLLGFDATATALIASLKIALQDKRIHTIIKQEVKQKILAGEAFELHSPWDVVKKENALSYTEAVLLEALRLSPPAPVVPEIISEAITLNIDDFSFTLPAGSLVFIPMQNLHTHEKHFPDIVLSEEGQKVIGKKLITANDIFPERWGPKQKNNELYNANFFSEDTDTYKPGVLQKEGRFLTFKTGARRCPGLRIALTELLSIFRILATYKIELTGEEDLQLSFHYETPLQRNGGMGLMKITPKNTLTTMSTVSSKEEQSALSRSGFHFFSQAQIPETQDLSTREPLSENSSFLKMTVHV